MLMRFLGCLYAFLMAAALSTGITLSPIAVAWNSIWVYVIFAACIIPGTIAAWLTITVVVGLFALIGVGTMAGTAMLADEATTYVRKMRRRKAGQARAKNSR